MRVRRRGRESSSISRRARSTAADDAVPSAGTWLRRAGASGLGAVAVSRFVIVIDLPLPVPSAARPRRRTSKNPRLPARVPSVVGGFALAALVPPSSSVLPPGAGNKAEKAVQPKEERAKNPEERYVSQAVPVDGQLDAATVRRDGDHDVSAIPALELGQHGLH